MKVYLSSFGVSHVSPHTCASRTYLYVAFSVCFGRQFQPKRTKVVMDFVSIDHSGMQDERDEEAEEDLGFPSQR